MAAHKMRQQEQSARARGLETFVHELQNYSFWLLYQSSKQKLFRMSTGCPGIIGFIILLKYHTKCLQ